MAELDIGLHCSFIGCHQLDFLPFECDGCSKIFCLNHKGRTAHDCTDVNFMGRSQPSTSDAARKCSLANCDKIELVPILCKNCTNQFCVVHRLPEEHQCSALLTQTELPTKSQAFNLSAYSRGVPKSRTKVLSPKQQALTAKLALMKLKQKAAGDDNIPLDHRVFFSIKRPYHDQNLQIFVPDRWTIGQLLDKVASDSGLMNLNNNSLMNRLILKNTDAGTVLDPSEIISTAILKKTIFSGSALELYYYDI